MVRVKGPLHSTDARGTLAGSLTFQKSLNQMSGKSCKFKTYSRSYLQGRDRDWLTWSVGIWHGLPEPTVEAWVRYTDFKGLTGYHSFIRLFLQRTHSFIYQYEAPPHYGFCVVGNHYVGQFVSGGDYQVPMT